MSIEVCFYFLAIVGVAWWKLVRFNFLQFCIGKREGFQRRSDKTVLQLLEDFFPLFLRSIRHASLRYNCVACKHFSNSFSASEPYIPFKLSPLTFPHNFLSFTQLKKDPSFPVQTRKETLNFQPNPKFILFGPKHLTKWPSLLITYKGQMLMAITKCWPCAAILIGSWLLFDMQGVSIQIG